MNLPVKDEQRQACASACQSRLTRYMLDGDNRIRLFEKDCGNALCRGCAVGVRLGCDIKTIYADAESRMLYEKLFEKTRELGKAVSIRSRCDDTTTIRHMEIEVMPMSGGLLMVEIRLLDERQRNAGWVRQHFSTLPEIITMCSLCGDIRDERGRWQAIEAEINRLGMFSMETLPRISHGLCPECVEVYMAEIRSFAGEKVSGDA